VIHRDERVVAAVQEVAERGIGDERPRQHRAATRLLERGRDDVRILVAEQTVLARVRVETDDADPRRRQPEVSDQRLRDELDHAAHPIGRELEHDLDERPVDRRERDLELRADKEHRDIARAEPVREHLGVTEVLEPAAPRPGLRDRCGD